MIAHRDFLKKFIIVIAIFCAYFSNSLCKDCNKAQADPSQQVYFSPDGQIKNRIISEIGNAEGSIDIAVYNFTSRDIKSALKKAKKRGVAIRILLDRNESKDAHSASGALKNDGFSVKLLKGTGRNGLMHHKFAVFDKKLLLTGSYNWTQSAEHYNYENALFLRDKTIIKDYMNEFERLWSRSGS